MVIGTEGRGPEFLYVRMHEKNGLVPEKVLGTAKGSYSANAPSHGSFISSDDRLKLKRVCLVQQQTG